MNFKEFYSFQYINEATATELRQGTSKTKKLRSEPVSSEYVSINKQGTVKFKSTAVTTPGVDNWIQEIKPVKRVRATTTLKNFRDAYNKDLLVKCKCNDFKYRYAYRATEDGYILGKKEGRDSDITNPSPVFPEGTVCKHIHNALSVIKANIPKMYKEFKEKN